MLALIDDRNGSHEFRRNLERNLKARTTGANGAACVRKVTMEASHSNNLLQVADMICGALNRSFTANDERFRRLIRQPEKFVTEWPLK
jgi:hypothetical protein